MSDEIVNLLALGAMGTFFLILTLVFVLLFINFKEKRNRQKKENEEKNKTQIKKSSTIYTPESILDFMEFEKVEDNMIIQKNGKYLMVIECHGINYDLMSEMEQVSVEQGFIAFLNTLRYPIQLYIQTRTVNLERSVEGYKNKLNDIDIKYEKVKIEYELILKQEKASKQEIEKVKYEMVKLKNLRDYTADIIKDIERQSLNQNILSKKYYVVIPCYKTEIEAGEFDESEVRNMAFSELYTRARAIINSLFSCQVTGRVLDSEELIELLYIAYNRDEADLFWMDKIKEAGFDELYSTAPDVIEKKSKMLDKQIEDKAINLANKKVSEARSDKEIELLEKEKNEKELVNQKAKELIKKHKKYIGEDIANKAIDKINQIGDKTEDKGKRIIQKKEEKEEISNGIIKEKGKRGRPRKK